MPSTPPDRDALKQRTARVLREYLAESGQTQQWLADRTGIGLRTLARYLSGETKIGYNDVELIRHVLEVDPHEFHARFEAAA